MKKWYNVEFAQNTRSMIQRVNDFRDAALDRLVWFGAITAVA